MSETDKPVITLEADGTAAPSLDLVERAQAEAIAATAREAAIAEAEASGAARARREGRIDEESATVLDQLAERALMLLARRDAINQDIRDLFGFAGDIGFHKSALRGAINDMRKTPDARKEAEAQREIYRAALGVEGPDFVIALPRASATAPKAERRITAKEKAFQDAMLLAHASSAADAA